MYPKEADAAPQQALQTLSAYCKAKIYLSSSHTTDYYSIPKSFLQTTSLQYSQRRPSKAATVTP